MSEEQHTPAPQHLRGCGPNHGAGSPSTRLKSRHRRSERKMPLKEFARTARIQDAKTWMRNKRMTQHS
jgi:hypothetical protein